MCKQHLYKVFFFTEILKPVLTCLKVIKMLSGRGPYFFNFQPPLPIPSYGPDNYVHNKRICNQQSFNFVFPKLYLFFALLLVNVILCIFLQSCKPLEKRSKENNNDRLQIFSQENNF